MKANRKTVRMTEPELFGACLRQHREDLEYTQEQVASWIGRTGSWLSYIERGHLVRPPRWEDFHLLCQYLEANAVQLLVECGYISEQDARSYRFTK